MSQASLDNGFKCGVCCQYFPSLRLFGIHVRKQHHQQNALPVDQRVKYEYRLALCSKCAKFVQRVDAIAACSKCNLLSVCNNELSSVGRVCPDGRY